MTLNLNHTNFKYDKTSSRSFQQQVIDELFYTRCEIRDYVFSGRCNPQEYKLYTVRERQLMRYLKDVYDIEIPHF